MAYAYIISKCVFFPQLLSNPTSQLIVLRRLDPVFAIAIGAAAAFSRISREEREKGRDMGQSLEVFKRRFGLVREGWGF